MKPFKFQQFDIKQSKSVFRVGTDAVLLGALANCTASEILEVGTGTGIVSLMMAQRNPNTCITAIDISQEAVLLAKENFETSPFHNRLQAKHMDFKDYPCEGKIQQIVSNPPYFEKNPSNKDIVARQNIKLNFHQLIGKSSEILSIQGVLSVIIPSYSSENFIEIAGNHQLFLKRTINIYGLENGILKRNILEFSKSTSSKPDESDFVIEQKPRQYSEQYLLATQDFHIFGKQ